MKRTNETMRKFRNGLRAKDLITAGIFTMLFFIVVFIFAMALSAVPVASLFITCADALAGGVIFLYLAMKVRKFGAVAIMSAIIGLIMCLVGHFWPCIIFGIVFGLAADFLCSRGGHTTLSSPRSFGTTGKLLAGRGGVPGFCAPLRACSKSPNKNSN